MRREMVGSNGKLPADTPRRRLVRATAETSANHGKRPADRTVEERLEFGVINLDKPSGPSSHQVAAWVRDVFGSQRVGHGGTLDPRVTGLLPTALNSATRGVGALLEAGKEYLAVMRLHGDASRAKVEEASASFVGKVKQKPPVRSAVKRRVRSREIYYLEVMEHEGRDVLLSVGCEAGTYVRNLCIDIGKAVGTRAHMQQLRRTRTGPFTLADAHTLHQVRDAWETYRESEESDDLLSVLLPHEALFEHLPKIVVRDSAIGALCHGAQLHVPGVLAVDDTVGEGDTVLVESLKGEAVALAEAAVSARSLMDASQGLAARPSRILLPKSTYPKVWKREAA